MKRNYSFFRLLNLLPVIGLALILYSYWRARAAGIGWWEQTSFFGISEIILVGALLSSAILTFIRKVPIPVPSLITMATSVVTGMFSVATFPSPGPGSPASLEVTFVELFSFPDPGDSISNSMGQSIVSLIGGGDPEAWNLFLFSRAATFYCALVVFLFLVIFSRLDEIRERSHKRGLEAEEAQRTYAEAQLAAQNEAAQQREATREFLGRLEAGELSDYELRELAIAAQDRTTHAVRALVRFIFIQLVATTFAAVLWAFAVAAVDPAQCVLYGDYCEPIVWLQIFAVLVWLVGVIASSNAGWDELRKSEIPWRHSLIRKK